MEKENRGTPAEDRERLLKQVTSLMMRLHVISPCHSYFLNAVAGLSSVIACNRMAAACTMKETGTFTIQCFSQKILLEGQSGP